MAGRWRELFGSDEKRFRSRLAFGQSHAESSSANVARENAPGREYFNDPAQQPAHAGWPYYSGGRNRVAGVLQHLGSTYLVLHSTSDHFSPYLSFFSLFPLISHSCFLPPNFDALFPLNLSPSIFSVKSRGNSLSMNFRTAENVRVLAFSFRSLSFSAFWSGQLIVPASLSPSILIVKVAVSFWLPIS